MFQCAQVDEEYEKFIKQLEHLSQLLDESLDDAKASSSESSPRP